MYTFLSKSLPFKKWNICSKSISFPDNYMISTSLVNLQPFFIDQVSIFSFLKFLPFKYTLNTTHIFFTKNVKKVEKSPISTELSTMTLLSFIMTCSLFLTKCDVIYYMFLHFSAFFNLYKSKFNNST